MKIVFLFPGQGSQYVGMGREFCERSERAMDVFAMASEVCGRKLTTVCFEGPEDELNRTDVSQPAILTVSLAILETIKEHLGTDSLRPTATAGLSLGEWTALAFAGAVSYSDAVSIVQKRGMFMQNACDLVKSGMLSLLGIERSQAETICNEASSDGVVCISNLNSPGQVVVSGDLNALERVKLIAPKMGVKRVIPLKVAGAFHSPLMKPAEDSLVNEVAKINISHPQTGIYSNVTAKLHEASPESIRKLLCEQLTQPVLWTDSILNIQKELAPDLYVEIGPNKVLSGILKKILPEADCINIDSYDNIELLREHING